jgi:phosphopantothenoylcysteine decarboxylase/phosphopantothenate--cysteine ligase
VVGKGRMPEIELLQEALEYALTPKTMAGKRVLITAGGTQEQIDPVRFISNYSTGKMGVALAHACARRGAHVTLVCGCISVPVYNPFGQIERIDALSAQAMHEVCVTNWPQQDIAILCAAVADFAPESTAENKIKKVPGQTALDLHLTTTPDIARAMGQTKRKDQTLVGFALETEHEKENALHKMERKSLDAIVLNSLRDKGAGFGTDTNIVTILQADGSETALPLQSKAVISEEILRVLFS